MIKLTKIIDFLKKKKKSNSNFCIVFPIQTLVRSLLAEELNSANWRTRVQACTSIAQLRSPINKVSCNSKFQTTIYISNISNGCRKYYCFSCRIFATNWYTWCGTTGAVPFVTLQHWLWVKWMRPERCTVSWGDYLYPTDISEGLDLVDSLDAISPQCEAGGGSNCLAGGSADFHWSAQYNDTQATAYFSAVL